MPQFLDRKLLHVFPPVITKKGAVATTATAPLRFTVFVKQALIGQVKIITN